MKKIVASCLLSALAISPVLSAAEVESDSGFVVGENIGFLFPDSDRNLDSDLFVEYYGGYRFGPEWEVQLGYVIGGYDNDGGIGNGKIDPGYTLDVVYHFLNGKWQPYASAGITDFTYDYSGIGVPDQDGDANLALGFGVKRFFGPSMFASGEFKQVLDSEEGDTMLSVGLGYLFGQKAAKPAKAAPAPAPVVARDSDNDGVPNSADQCPGTAAGVGVDANGCPKDSDNDGVLDYKDECPNTVVGADIDAQGCEVEYVDEKVSIELSVQFDTNSSVLRAGSKAEIAKAADFLNTYRNSSVVIEGHTDNTGAASYNKSLSQKRADAVKAVLVDELGVSANRVSAVGYGEERPIADNSTTAGRQKNRRVLGVIEGQKSVRKN